MAIKELFYDNRPQVLLDPRASQRIDPRFKFTRASTASAVSPSGVLRILNDNEPSITYDPATGEPLGLALEPTRTNKIFYSDYFYQNGSYPAVEQNTPDTASPTGEFNATKATQAAKINNAYQEGTATRGYLSFFAKKGSTKYIRYIGSGVGSNNSTLGPVGVSSAGYRYAIFNLDTGEITGDGAGPWTMQRYGNGWWRISAGYTTNPIYSGSSFFVATLDDTNPVFTELDETATVYLFGAQYEVGDSLTSYIGSVGAAATTRAASLLSIEAPLPASGSVYIDARAVTASENDTLLSLKNSDNDKIDLAYLSNTDTYDSLALIANYDGTSKTSLPLPVPTTDRERNIITWGANNYQYTRDSSRFATSLSSSVPTGLNQLSIGHDAVDPAKAFNGYINTVYAWSGELTPAVAEALVRNEIDAINADTYSPVGPAGSLALVINTQGATTSGDKTFTLPAESTADDNDIVITWGDDTESLLNGSSAKLGASGLTHTYPAAGIYPVWVEGQMEGIRFNNTASALDVLQIAAWGTTANGNDVFRSPSTMNSAFYGCSQMDFSTPARTNNLPDTSAVTDWYRAFRDCSSITGTFPAFNFSAATTFQEAWQGCSSMAAFVAAGDQTQNVTNFSSAWYNCSGLTSFPQINTSSGTNFYRAWFNCSSLTDFPLINTAAGTNFDSAWYNCSSLDNIANKGEATSFPLIDTSAGTNFNSAWFDCSSLTDFPQINTAAGTNFVYAWRGCTSLTDFPLINTAAGTNFVGAWQSCSSLETFPLIDTAAGTNLSGAWRDCSSLDNIVNAGEATSFPLINTAATTNFDRTWENCSSLTIFPQINTAAGISFVYTWLGCSNLTSFPLINVAAGTNFAAAWSGCSSLTDFPANFFDSWAGTPANDCFYNAWNGCSSLTPASVVNILNSIAASGQSAPSGPETGDTEITIDWDGTGNPATDAAAAITTLKDNGWDVVLNGVSQ